MCWSAGTKWGFPAASSLPRSLSCRVWELVARRALPGRRARRGKLSWYALSGLPGKLLLPGSCLFPARSSCRGLGRPSQQAPLAGALVGLPGKLLLPGPWFEYFVLEWSSKEPWRVFGGRPASLCRGVLQLPVHEFGILGYPYSSTPTGAPGPGPYMVPSAVGTGPKQCTGARGLGHAAYLSAPTAHAQNSTRQTRRRG